MDSAGVPSLKTCIADLEPMSGTDRGKLAGTFPDARRTGRLEIPNVLTAEQKDRLTHTGSLR